MEGSRQKQADWRFRSFLLCCVIASVRKGCLPYVTSDGEAYVLQRESEVQAIVKQAVQNDVDSCDLVRNFTASACSRAACSRLVEDIRNYQCINVSLNSLCRDPLGQGVCNTVRVNYQRSYVRLPGFSKSSGTDLSTETTFAICAHRMLDQTFVAAHQNSTDRAYYHSFFGAVDGTHRFYPGTEVQDCDLYDPRFRPWYKGAISVLKDLVVLVDVAYPMAQRLGIFKITTALAGAQSITEQLLRTLTQGDRATVLSYSSPPTANLLGQLRITDNADASTDPMFQQIEELSVNASAPVSNLTTALSQALQVFQIGSPDRALKIVLVLTNGQSPASPEELSPLLAQLNNTNIALFVYEIGNTDPALAAVACKVKQGHIETVDIDSLQNPLLAIKSYFTFLARSRTLATPSQLAFWQLAYNDSNFRGQVITVAYPAVAPDGRLIGVAGIDMQVGQISQVLQSEITEFLTHNRIPQSPLTYPGGAPSVSPCPTVKTDPKQCNSNLEEVARNALCQQTDYLHMNYTDLLCCPGCGGVPVPASHSSRLKWIIIAAAAGGALVVGVVSCFLWMWCWDSCRKSIGRSKLDTNASSAQGFEFDVFGNTNRQSPGCGRRI